MALSLCSDMSTIYLSQLYVHGEGEATTQIKSAIFNYGNIIHIFKGYDEVMGMFFYIKKYLTFNRMT